MSNSNSHKINLIEQAIYDDIERLTTDDGYTYEMLADFCGYSGVNSLRNIVRQGAHSLSIGRFARMLKQLSKRGNFRTHRHVVDGRSHVISPRVSPSDQPLNDLHDTLVRWVHIVEMAIEAGNVNKVYEYYRFLLKLASKVQLEMGQMQIRFQTDRQALVGLEKSTPGGCSARRLIEPASLDDGKYTIASHARKVNLEVEATHA